ncbi:MAG TPA: DUF6483 family protein [Thermoclostridium sp.]
MMMYEKDYIMRIISNMINFLAKIVFGKSNAVYEISEDERFKESDELHQELLDLISKGKINEAENMLFDRLNPDDKRQIMVAIDFYRRLNSFDDEFLEKNNFSRQEIEEGLRDLANKAGIIIYE